MLGDDARRSSLTSRHPIEMIDRGFMIAALLNATAIATVQIRKGVKEEDTKRESIHTSGAPAAGQ